MSNTVSPSANRRYGMRRVCQEWGAPRATMYRHKRSLQNATTSAAKKRGPKTKHTDAELVTEIRAAIESSPFVGEGHRKVWAQLRAKGITTSKKRVLRLMRENKLLAPGRPKRVLGPRAHDGTIVTDAPNVMWGTDATTVLTLDEGNATVFIAVDHCTSECVGIHAAKRGDRFEALEPIRQGVRDHFGTYDAGAAKGLTLRHDNGTQYTSDDFQDEIDFLGIESSPSFVRSPEGNGCAERFIRTLKEQLLWVQAFRTVEELRAALMEWAVTYNEHWLVERHGHRSPRAIRRQFEEAA